MKKLLTDTLIQMIPVMLGVYLGFALNNFGEAQKLKKQAGTYQEMLKNEIGENLAELERVNPYHLELKQDFAEILASNDIKKAFRSKSMQGIRPGLVNKSAYNTGIQTGIIQQFDLDVIQNVNKLYTLQDQYDAFNETIISSFIAQKFPETEAEIRNALIIMSMNMNDVLNFERELTESYAEILNAF